MERIDGEGSTRNVDDRFRTVLSELYWLTGTYYDLCPATNKIYTAVGQPAKVYYHYGLGLWVRFEYHWYHKPLPVSAFIYGHLCLNYYLRAHRLPEFQAGYHGK